MSPDQLARSPQARFKVGTTHTDSGYEGVLRRNTTIVWRCGHLHDNRDTTTRANYSARDCITDMVKACRTPQLRQVHRDGILARPDQAQHKATKVGHQFPPERLAHMREQTQTEADTFIRDAERIAWMLDGCPVFQPGSDLAPPLMPPAPSGVCPACGVAVAATRFSVSRGWFDWWATDTETFTQRCPQGTFGTHPSPARYTVTTPDGEPAPVGSCDICGTRDLPAPDPVYDPLTCGYCASTETDTTP